jgi:hypothetical protein
LPIAIAAFVDIQGSIVNSPKADERQKCGAWLPPFIETTKLNAVNWIINLVLTRPGHEDAYFYPSVLNWHFRMI